MSNSAEHHDGERQGQIDEHYRRFKRWYRLSNVPFLIFIVVGGGAAGISFLYGMTEMTWALVPVGLVALLLLAFAAAAGLRGRATKYIEYAIEACPEATWTIDDFERSDHGSLRLFLWRAGWRGQRLVAEIDVFHPEREHDHLLQRGATVVARVTPVMEGHQWGEVDWEATYRTQHRDLPASVATQHLTCSSCGARLPPVAQRPTVLCTYCNTENHVVRR